MPSTLPRWVTLLLLAACDGSSTVRRGPCTADTDCTPPLRCADARCKTPRDAEAARMRDVLDEQLAEQTRQAAAAAQDARDLHRRESLRLELALANIDVELPHVTDSEQRRTMLAERATLAAQLATLTAADTPREPGR